MIAAAQHIAGIIPHVHVFHMMFIVPNSVGVPGWWFTAGQITGAVVFYAWIFLWIGKHAKAEEETRIQHIEKDLG